MWNCRLLGGWLGNGRLVSSLWWIRSHFERLCFPYLLQLGLAIISAKMIQWPAVIADMQIWLTYILQSWPLSQLVMIQNFLVIFCQVWKLPLNNFCILYSFSRIIGWLGAIRLHLYAFLVEKFIHELVELIEHQIGSIENFLFLQVSFKCWKFLLLD